MTAIVSRGPGIAWEVPPGLVRHQPAQVRRVVDAAWPELAGQARPTYMHPAVPATVIAGYAWMVLAFWAVFGGHGYMGLALVLVTLISAVMVGLLVTCGSARTLEPWQRSWRSFGEFWDGEMEIWDGRISGRAAFVQLAVLAWALAGLATAFVVIVASVR